MKRLAMSHAAAGVSVSRCLQLAAYSPEPQKTYGRIPAIRGGERRLDSGGAQGKAPSQLEAKSCLAHEGHCMWHVGWEHRAYEHSVPRACGAAVPRQSQLGREDSGSVSHVEKRPRHGAKYEDTRQDGCCMQAHAGITIEQERYSYPKCE